ncbi:MAG: GNAT family N-acetyltransferase, partial [Planctomycetota bacterium]
MSIMYYHGRRIYLRPLELSDEPRLRRWINDPENWKTLKRYLPANELREREFVEGLYKSPEKIALGVVVRDGEHLIGVTGLHMVNPVSRSAVFGIMIGDRKYQSRGYGTETTRLTVRYGFKELNLNRISLSVFADHERAIRAYRRAGFVQEGC